MIQSLLLLLYIPFLLLEQIVSFLKRFYKYLDSLILLRRKQAGKCWRLHSKKVKPHKCWRCDLCIQNPIYWVWKYIGKILLKDLTIMYKIAHEYFSNLWITNVIKQTYSVLIEIRNSRFPSSWTSWAMSDSGLKDI